MPNITTNHAITSPNPCTVKVRLHECLVAQLGGAIFDFVKERSAHVQMIKTLTTVKIKPCPFTTGQKFIWYLVNEASVVVNRLIINVALDDTTISRSWLVKFKRGVFNNW